MKRNCSIPSSIRYLRFLNSQLSIQDMDRKPPLSSSETTTPISMSEVILQTRHLAIGYPLKKNNAKRVQESLNLEMRAGEMIALVGSNGAGKSTLLRSLCGLQKCLEGEIIIQGKEMQSLSPSAKAKTISVVLTHHADTNLLSVKEVVSIGRQPYTNWIGTNSEMDDEIIRQSLSTVQISHLTERRLSELSDGEKQKVWIAMALAQNTPIILLDEPTSHLDYKNKTEIFKLLKQLSQTGKSILISTHEIDLSLQYADQLWVMEKGVHQGTPQEMEQAGILERVLGYSQNPSHISL